ncbi:MAG: ATP-dependent metalloprotease FtsH [Deltaproteobacteria bacterium]|nr:ATP-dependent metalloprotease FtsH [Deltaproteobacteria bacterium]
MIGTRRAWHHGMALQPVSPTINPRPRWGSWISLILLLALVWMWSAADRAGNQPEVAYSTVYGWIHEGKVESVVLEGKHLSGKLREQQPVDNRSVRTFRTLVPDDQDLVRELRDRGVAIRVESSDTPVLLQVLYSLLPWILILGAWWWLSRRARSVMASGGPLGGFLRRGKRFERSLTNDVTFANVAGLSSAKRDLEEIVQFLREPDRARRLGARVPRGVLLIGPPGTGKTLLARAIAGEAGAPFYSITASEFIEMFVGVGAARVRELFEEAKRNAPSIVFIDEIDAVGRMRGAGVGGGHDEREQTLNQLLSEMDGFDRDTRVIVLAATNRPDVLDPALLRPGRFDRRVVVELPEAQARRAILAVHTSNKPLGPDVDLERLAESTVGFSGADLANLANEAALSATRRRADQIEREDFTAAYDKIVLGDPREAKLRDVEKRRVAVHEAGHALMAWVTPEAEPTRRVSILPRGMALGATHQVPAEDRHLHTRAELVARLLVLLGGYASERSVLGDISTGATHDLREATRLASQMVAHYGMSEGLGPVYYEHQEDQVFLGQRVATDGGTSDATVHEIETEVRALLGQVLARTGGVIEAERAKLDLLVAALLDRETLEREDLETLLGRPATTPDALPVTAPIPPSSVAPAR